MDSARTLLTLTRPAGAGAKKPPALWQQHKAMKDTAVDTRRIVPDTQIQHRSDRVKCRREAQRVLQTDQRSSAVLCLEFIT